MKWLCVAIEIYFSWTILKLVGHFIPDHRYNVDNVRKSVLNWFKNVQKITSLSVHRLR